MQQSSDNIQIEAAQLQLKVVHQIVFGLGVVNGLIYLLPGLHACWLAGGLLTCWLAGACLAVVACSLA